MGIITADFKDEMEQAFIDYSMSVITDRALPNAADGLKPVSLRILWSMFEGGYTNDKPHRKCARIVGDTMGKYHPHGDSSIYGNLINIAQPWNMRYPLVDVHGNCGSQDGDPPAAQRYTECRLTKFAELSLKDIKKDTVDFRPNFDETEKEPSVLPGLFPHLLCNPTMGIAVGMACSFAPHNLTEICNVIIQVLEDNNISTEEILKTITGPDFPTGGIIINKDELLAAYKTGKGRARIRGRYTIETNKKTKQESIVFTEMPYGVKKEKLIMDIAALCEVQKGDTEPVIDGISEIRDESSKDIRLVFELKKNTNAEFIVSQLFKKTNLEITYSYNQVALVDKEPRLLNFKSLIEIYIKHQKDIIIRATNFDLKKAKARLEIVEGLLIAIVNIEEIINTIKNSNSIALAKVALENKFGFTSNQSQAIVDLKLGRLTKLEGIEVEKEKQELLSKIAECNLILSDEKKLNSVLKNKIIDMRDRFGDNRRTEITQIEISKDTKEIEMVKPEDVIVVVSKSGNVKKIPANTYKVQKKNGKGIKTSDDITMEVISTNTIDTLMIFTNKGKLYRLLVDNIPTSTNAGKGTSLLSLISLDLDETIAAITSLNRENAKKYVLFATKTGLIKKTALSEYSSVRKNNGVIAIKLREEDSVVSVSFVDDEQAILITKEGLSIRFKTDIIGAVGKVALGVKGIELSETDEVIELLIIEDSNQQLAVFSLNGMAKKTSLHEFPLQNRGGRGTIVYKPNESTGSLVGAILINKNNNILIMGQLNSICISAEDIPELNKAAIGNIILKNKIMSIAKI